MQTDRSQSELTNFFAKWIEPLPQHGRTEVSSANAAKNANLFGVTNNSVHAGYSSPKRTEGLGLASLPTKLTD
jgi:hypothetical protein